VTYAARALLAAAVLAGFVSHGRVARAQGDLDGGIYWINWFDSRPQGVATHYGSVVGVVDPKGVELTTGRLEVVCTPKPPAADAGTCRYASRYTLRNPDKRARTVRLVLIADALPTLAKLDGKPVHFKRSKSQILPERDVPAQPCTPDESTDDLAQLVAEVEIPAGKSVPLAINGPLDVNEYTESRVPEGAFIGHLRHSLSRWHIHEHSTCVLVWPASTWAGPRKLHLVGKPHDYMHGAPVHSYWPYDHGSASGDSRDDGEHYEGIRKEWGVFNSSWSDETRDEENIFGKHHPYGGYTTFGPIAALFVNRRPAPAGRLGLEATLAFLAANVAYERFPDGPTQTALGVEAGVPANGYIFPMPGFGLGLGAIRRYREDDSVGRRFSLHTQVSLVGLRWYFDRFSNGRREYNVALELGL
jgi:hypothetical protein